MKSKILYSILILMIFFLSAERTYSQEITDVSFELIGEDIFIYYTLTAPSDEEYEISTVLKRLNDVSFEYIPDDLSEDIGDDQYAGVRKKIIWDVSEEEFGMFDGEDFYFEVIATKVTDSGGIPWYYFVGTAAVGGAVAAVVLLGGSDGDSSDPPSTTNFPTPPGRP